MDKKVLIPSALVAMVLLGIVTAGASGSLSVAEENPELIKEIPETYKEAEQLVEESIGETDTDAEVVPIPRRFLMWTHDGVHIMWGRYANGYFVGEDNLGKKAWGIYHHGIFAGFYDGDFFQGKYRGHWRGIWKAEGLFGEEYSRGGFLTFPHLRPVAVAAKPLPVLTSAG